MRRLSAAILLFFVISCGETDMPLPPDHQYVTAADAGPGAPFAQVECPSDDAEAAAADIRRVCACCLANHASQQTRINELNPTYATSADTDETLAVSTTGYTQFGSVEAEFVDSEVGQVIEIHASGRAWVQDDGGGQPLEEAYVALYVTDDADGAGAAVPIEGAIQTIHYVAPSAYSSGGAASPGFVNFSFTALHAITAAGTTRVELRGAVISTDDTVTLKSHSMLLKRTQPT